MVLTIEAQSATELRQKVLEMAQVFGVTQNQTQTQADPAQLSFPMDDSEQAQEESPAPKKSKTKKAKAESPETAPAVVPETTPQEEPTEPTITLETVRQELLKVNEAFGEDGPQKVRDLLGSVGAVKISAVHPKDYAAFIKSCQEAIKNAALG